MNRPQVGDRINNYLLDEIIGTGTFGEVWKAHHHVFTGDAVAIKMPTDPEYVRHLQREGIVVHGLRDPRIVRVLDLDPYADQPYLIMEYVDGPSLREMIDANPNGLPIDAVVAIIYGLLMALEAAHAGGLIHRDVKPANVLISGRDMANMTPDRVKVTDFGLGHASDAGRHSIMQSGSVSTEAGQRIAGTFAYMSPEQRDGRPIDARSDLYAVGVVLHEILTGVLPQGHDLPSSIRKDIPRWLDQVFEKCYTRQDQRYSSTAEIREVIQHYWEPAHAWLAAAAQADSRRGMRWDGRSWRCVACNAVVGQDNQYCIHCGRQLVDVVPRCPSCHGFVGRMDNFCILCGTDLRVKA